HIGGIVVETVWLVAGVDDPSGAVDNPIVGASVHESRISSTAYTLTSGVKVAAAAAADSVANVVDITAVTDGSYNKVGTASKELISASSGRILGVIDNQSRPARVITI